MMAGIDQPEQTSEATPTFEQALERLETIVARLERGDLPLEEGLAAFEQGVALVRLCDKQLTQARGRLLQWVDFDDAGQARLKPFQHQASTETTLEKPSRRRRSESETDENGLF